MKYVFIILALIAPITFASISLDEKLDSLSLKISQDNDSPELYLERGKLFLKMQKLNEAKADFAYSLELEPKNGDAHFHLSEIAFLEGNYDKAELEGQAFMGMLKRGDVRLAIGYNQLGKVYLVTGQFSRATLAFQGAVDYAAEPMAEYYLDLAEAYLQLKNKELAAYSLRKGIQAMGGHPLLSEKLAEINGRKTVKVVGR